VFAVDTALDRWRMASLPPDRGPKPAPRFVEDTDIRSTVRIKNQKNYWAGLMFTVVGVAFALGALHYNFGSSARPGPGYFPFGLAILMALLGAFVLFESLTIEHDDSGRVGRFSWRPLLAILAAIVVFGATLVPLGLGLALPLLIIISSLAGDEFHWKDVLVNCIVLTIGSWAIFIVGLKLVIPLWPAFITAG
jgi:hypothetical protein